MSKVRATPRAKAARRKSSRPGFLAKTHPAVRSQLRASTDLPTFLASAGNLTLNDRKRIVDQALVLIDDNYVHLPLKEAMHGVNPLQRLRLLRHRLEQETRATMGSEFAFHREMLEIFNSLRDLHTNYLLPDPFRGKLAFLPFDIEECFDQGRSILLATHVVPGFTHPHFRSGVQITSWNGVPIQRAVEVNGDAHAGSNAAARRARGIESMTVRPLTGALPPDEVWVIIGYTDLDGVDRELRQDWLVTPELPAVRGADPGRAQANAACLGLDLHMADVRRAKAMLFAPQAIAAEKMAKPARSSRPAAAGQAVPSAISGVFHARSVTTPSGEFGHIRIFTFDVDDPTTFVEEFIRLAELLPQNGLIVDVRGNGGGHIWAAEGLLQVMTPVEIEPEPTQFVNTPLNLKLCKRHENNPLGIDLGPWVESITQSIETGAVYSRGYPITPPEFANQWGQRYHGPAVLITNARCYSATDIFAAGFQDHGIGVVLGTEANTGAGGANVWTHRLLRNLLELPTPADPDSPYRSLGRGADLRVSMRRTLRVGERAGTPLEDLGVRPDQVHPMTRRDILEGNVDLIDRAGEILSAMEVCRLQVTLHRSSDSLGIFTGTTGLARLDVYVDGRPVESAAVSDGPSTIRVPVAGNAGLLELAGFDSRGDYVAARKIVL